MSTLAVNGLTDRQAEFVRQICLGKSQTESAREAGYTDFVQSGTLLMRSPSVLAAIHQGVQEALQQDAAVNLRVLRKIRDDDGAPARVRADIGIKLLNLAGHVVPSNKDSKPRKAISEMTQAELLDHINENQAAIDKAEAELMAKAKDITPGASVTDSAPKQGTETPKTMNYLD